MDNKDIKTTVNIIMQVFISLKDVCHKTKSCVHCPFNDEGDCLFECEPEDYQIEQIAAAMIKQVEKELAENGN